MECGHQWTTGALGGNLTVTVVVEDNYGVGEIVSHGPWMPTLS